MFGQNLEKLIEERNTNKTELAKYLDIYRSTLDSYIKCQTFMPSDLIEKTATYFKVSISFLFGEVQESENEYLRKQLAEMTKQLKENNKLLNKLLDK